MRTTPTRFIPLRIRASLPKCNGILEAMKELIPEEPHVMKEGGKRYGINSACLVSRRREEIKNLVD